MPKERKPQAPKSPTPPAGLPSGLLDDVRALITDARGHTARALNAGLVLLHWQIGRRIRTEILGEEHAAYGEQIVATLSQELTRDFGTGFTVSALSRMSRFAEVFPDREVIVSLAGELSWSHFVEIIPLDDPLRRDFYAGMARVERWSVRTLRDRMGGMLFERSALSKKPEELASKEFAALRESDRLSPDFVFRDPYILNFLATVLRVLAVGVFSPCFVLRLAWRPRRSFRHFRALLTH